MKAVTDITSRSLIGGSPVEDSRFLAEHAGSLFAHRSGAPTPRRGPRDPARCKGEKVQFRRELLRHARQEAEALAATTPFPSLFLPELKREKISEAIAYVERQEVIWNRSRPFVSQLS